MAAKRTEEYVEQVLSIVEQVPPGRVTTYGLIAEVVGSGPRLVGNVMATEGGGVPWWRVVRADGSLPPSHADEARQAYLAGGHADAAVRVGRHPAGGLAAAGGGRLALSRARRPPRRSRAPG